MFTLRPYQSRALGTLTRRALTHQFLLLQAATGAGKTVMFCALARYYYENWHMRCLILAHRAILVRQAMDKLLKGWEGTGVQASMGFMCASVSKSCDTDAGVIVGSPQTVHNHLGELPRVDVVIIDECHRLGPKNVSSVYGDVIRSILSRRPGARVFGVTATPYRLGQGYIYGSTAADGSEPWWPELDSRISMNELQRQGYLAPLRARTCGTLRRDLASVNVMRTGEYDERALAELMCRSLQLESAVKAFREYASDRKAAVAFCCTIQHAVLLAQCFNSAGISAAAVDSSRPSEENRGALRDFERGKIRVLCNVGILTEGWDCASVDCLIMCRPTMSPALYVQMVGRGLRTCPGKTDCLLLDLVDNVGRHGSPDHPRVRADGTKPLGGGASAKDGTDRSGKVECPWCGAVFSGSAKKLRCPECGAPLVSVNDDRMELEEVSFDVMDLLEKRGEAVRRARTERLAREAAMKKRAKEEEAKARAEAKERLIAGGRDFQARLTSISEPVRYVIASGGGRGCEVLRVRLFFSTPLAPGRELSVTLLLDPAKRVFLRTGNFWLSAVTRQFWDACGGARPLPLSNDRMLARWKELRFPDSMTLRQSGSGYLSIRWPEGGKLRGAKA